MLDVAYLNYGEQSGVTQHVAEALAARGHRLQSLTVPGPLEFRDETGRRRVRWSSAVHLALSALRFGPQGAMAHRWNTTYAFDVHSRRAGELLAALPQQPQVVLQNGALFSPGLVPAQPFTLLLDHTRALSMEHAGAADYGIGWRERETRLYRSARTIATFSRHVAGSLRRDYGVAEGRVHVAGGGANVYPERIERRDDGQTILFVGKDFHRKGGPSLVRAFQQLHRKRPSLRLIIAGPKETLDLPDGVSNRGFVPMDQLAALFAEATVFAMPSLREPFGIAFLDAMACGLPCVGTAIEAIPEVVDHRVTGLLVPPGDDGALSTALLSLLDDPSRSHAMGLRGRLRVDAQFRWHHVGERLERALLAAATPREHGTNVAWPDAS